MALKGNLRDFSTTQLLNLVNLARKTGTLTIRDSEAPSRLSFREGKLIFATADAAGHESGLLVGVLQRTGKLSAERASAIRQGAGKLGDKQLGLMLINAGVVSQDDIMQSVRQHVLDITYGLFDRSEGLFRFDANILPPPECITVSIDLEGVIMDASRRIKQHEQLEGEMPSLDRALKFADRSNVRLRQLNLTEEEWRVISLVNPRNTIRQIGKANNLSDFQIRRIVYGLLQAGLVVMIWPEGIAPPGPRRGVPVGEPAAPPAPAVKRHVIVRLIDRIRQIQ